MTSGVLTDTEPKPDADPASGERPGRSPESDQRSVRAVPEIVRRRLARPMPADRMSWVATGVVVFIAALLRLYNLGWPPGKIFDETYYASEARALLEHGVEWDDNGAKYVVHPPLGKWCIALGEWLFDRPYFGWQANDEFGWRFSAAIAGIISIVIVIRIARRLFRSTILGCAAGLLLTLDGMHFVLSRTALLDIFLMLFLIAAFACLVLDREQRRARWLAALEAGLDPSRPGRAGLPDLGVPWWRLGAGVLLGCAGAVKWSAIYYMIAFVVLMIIWEVGTRRSAGAWEPVSSAVRTGVAWAFAMAGLAVTTYLLSWSGWFLTDDGYFRHWLADQGKPEGALGTLQNLWHYHVEAWKFHTGLSAHHQYRSWPWQWLLLGRPVAFYWSGDPTCGASSCAAEVLLLGTPVLWWSFLPALGALTWLGISRRDWRAFAIGLGVVAGIVPWFANQLDNRTMFYFYALPATPFLVLAVVYVLGVIIGRPSGDPGVPPDRRLYGVLIAGVFVALVAANFAYFFPIYTGESIPYAKWLARMWLGSRWI